MCNHRKGAIWSFTVLAGRRRKIPALARSIHEITGSAIPKEIPGLHAVNAVDAAGVHPLLFAIGSERYTPYLKRTQAPGDTHHSQSLFLGKSQLSLAKYLFIAAQEDDPNLNVNDIGGFLKHILQRIDLTRDLHFTPKLPLIHSITAAAALIQAVK